MAPIAVALANTPGWVPILISTGQHGEVVDRVFALFGLPIDVRHAPWERSGDLAGLHTTLVDVLTSDLQRLQPDAVVVQGDTATTLAAAISAFWLHVPVVHVEAGLRSGDLTAPFPEEANRRLVSQVTALHLAPTAGAVAALQREGITGDRVMTTGNTVIDALDSLTVTGTPRRERPLVLVTCHRRENWGQPMHQVADAVRQLAAQHPGVDFVVATHPNPEVKSVFTAMLETFLNVEIAEPIDYLPFVGLLAQATLVLTDSGGVQEEAPALGVPVLVLRDVTERPEGVQAGVAMLVGTDTKTIVNAANRLLSDPLAHQAMAQAVKPYGDGQAARRGVVGIGWLLDGTPRPEMFVPTKPSVQAENWAR